MNLKVTLTPINLNGEEESNSVEHITLTPSVEHITLMPRNIIDTEICLNVKCRSPFAKFKVSIVIDSFDSAYIQATFCNIKESVTIVNKSNEKRVMFDGFVRPDDEGITLPHIIGPSIDSIVAGRKVKDVVNSIQNQQTLLKVFINEANMYNKWLKKLICNNNDESVLVNNVLKFIKVDNNYVNINKKNNVTKWVPALNYCTGRQLLTILFVFKFK
ncbi:Mv-ORF9 peptide [Maruca vitrata nucleopolyhedrovirus]|uniref:Mv-ORF9 peptide n=1 Tax=Maruca vitrata nucleopolyhedrovirus TaxID=1307954 RepID=A1YR71_9ABAC|nr:Mv-ORF9 peptide [Maruca vitrata nucleopolyhedrovirus]ABL75961.1 Mv-ORF9 peptide [Maruca vitrata nucleopolyhedrovirus]